MGGSRRCRTSRGRARSTESRPCPRPAHQRATRVRDTPCPNRPRSRTLSPSAGQNPSWRVNRDLSLLALGLHYDHCCRPIQWGDCRLPDATCGSVETGCRTEGCVAIIEEGPQPMPSVNPEILIWARESADLDEDQACRKLNITRPRLADLESGRVDPTPSILETMARVYRQPLITFYLQAPPAECDYGIDYRTQKAEDGAKTLGAQLKVLIRDTRVSQEMLKDALDDEEELERLSFVASQSMSEGVERTVARLQEVVDITATQYYSERGPDDAFDSLRDRIHRAGAFVLIDDDSECCEAMAGLGDFRGLTIADPMTPFVVINGRCAKSVLSFSLLHELAHLILGNTGISGIDARNDVERYCADAASNFLLPSSELQRLQLRSKTESEATATQIERFASSRNLSRGMVAYRAWRSGKISSESYCSMNHRFRFEWDQFAKNQRVAQKEQDGRGSYESRRHQVGTKLIETTRLLWLSGTLTTIKAARILNIKAGEMQDFVDFK